LELSAQHLTVGGVLRFSSSFPSVPAALDIISVELSISQSYELQSFADPSRKVSVSPHKMVLFILDENSPKRGIPAVEGLDDTQNNDLAKYSNGWFASMGKEETFQVTQVTRVPDDDHLRPTTQMGTKTVIRISHEITLEIRFKATGQGTPPKVFKLTRPVTLSSVWFILRRISVIALIPPFNSAA
jgi:hypothetical protein